MIRVTRQMRWPVIALPILAAVLARPVGAQDPAPLGWNPQEILRTEGYVRPPADVERIIMTPRTDISFTAPSPDRAWFLRAVAKDRGDVADYGKEHTYLGGLQIDTKANRARSLTTSTRHGLVVVDPRTALTKTIETPKGASISAQVWSPSGAQIAYIANFETESHVFVADVATGVSAQLTHTPLLATLVTQIDFTGDGKSIIVVLVPEGRGAPPTHGKNGIEDGPEVRLTESRVIPQVVHPSLLDDPHDKALLTYYTTGQLALIDVTSKAVHTIGSPAMIRAVDASSDGKYLRVTRMVEPFSYLVPVSSFGSVQEVWDNTGRVLATLNKTPLREGERAGDADTPAGRGGAGRGGQPPAADTGRRDLQWNPVGPGLVYVQSVFAGGAGDAPAGAPNGRGGQAQRLPSSVRYVNWLPPFGPSDTKVVYEGSGRLTAVAYGADGRTMFVGDSGTVIAVRVSDPSKRFSLGRGVTLGGGGLGGRGGGAGGGAGVADSTSGGALAMRRGANGTMLVAVGTDMKTVFLSGTRTPGVNWLSQGPRPWLDKLDVESGQRARIFESPADAFDEFVTPLDDDYSQYIYTHESPTVITDAYLRDAKTGATTQITHNVDVAPHVTGALHRRMLVTRPRDGIKFWTDITLPAGWRPGMRMPGIIWFYPREYASQSDYDRSKYLTNINSFPELPSARPASATKLWVIQGYAVIEPDCPIVGDSGRMNDNYSRDLKENLDAVIDAVVDAGYVDRDRMGIGGHSYGAFSTVNALTLTPYFKAGIAGDGMYNRSLTPFGFQSERRNFFEAQDTYLDMSPFFRADKIAGALLMYHSMEDQNVGTAMTSSVRMFQALQGLGKPAALYLYPYEDHSVATYQSDLDLWARWFAWFDIYVKNSKPQTKAMVP